MILKLLIEKYFSGAEISTDDRSYLMFLMNAMNVKFSNAFFYPRMFPVVSNIYVFSQPPTLIFFTCSHLIPQVDKLLFMALQYNILV